jgi:hypothetical protein
MILLQSTRASDYGIIKDPSARVNNILAGFTKADRKIPTLGVEIESYYSLRIPMFT